MLQEDNPAQKVMNHVVLSQQCLKSEANTKKMGTLLLESLNCDVKVTLTSTKHTL